MKTEEWVSLLATGVDPVDRRGTLRRGALMFTAGVLVALLFTLGILHANPRMLSYLSNVAFWIREVYCAALGAVGLLAVSRLARPGRRLGPLPAALAVPVVAMWGLAVAALLTAPPALRRHLILGNTASVCSLLITFISVPLFVAFIGILREFAPTRLRLAGAAAGFAAGSLGALIYSLHCPELAPPFIGLWYLLGMLIPAALGAGLGPRLMRW